MNPETKKIMQKHLALLENIAPPHNSQNPKPRFFDSGILTVADVASLVGCSTRTIERCIQKGELKATRVGRKKLIRPEWVESWLKPKEV